METTNLTPLESAGEQAAPDIATAEEVLATFTRLMRSEKPAEQLKAAEQMAKYYSLFTPRDDPAVTPQIIAEVQSAVEEVRQGGLRPGLALPRGKALLGSHGA